MTDLLTTIHFLAFIGFGSLALASRSSVFKFEFSNIWRILYYTFSRFSTRQNGYSPPILGDKVGYVPYYNNVEYNIRSFKLPR